MNFLVTGGSRGIGAAIVLEAVREGHNVAFTYLREEEKARKVAEQALEINPGAICRFYVMDVRSSEQVEAVGNQILDEFERVDVVVNNAGISRNNLAVYMSDEEWHDVLETNLSGPFYVCRVFLPSMLAHKFGRIINISSVVAVGLAGQVNYAASKAGLLGLTRTLAKEYGPKNITANVIMPGYFETELTAESMSESFNKYWHTYCPLRRTGKLSEISKVVTFLASEGAGFINGASIPVTGGLDEGA